MFALVLLFAVAPAFAVPCTDGFEPSVSGRFPGDCILYKSQLNCCTRNSASAFKLDSVVNVCNSSSTCQARILGLICGVICDRDQGLFTNNPTGARVCQGYSDHIYAGCAQDNVYLDNTCRVPTNTADLIAGSGGLVLASTNCLGERYESQSPAAPPKTSSAAKLAMGSYAVALAVT